MKIIIPAGLTYLNLEQVALIEFIGDVLRWSLLQLIRHELERTILHVLLRLEDRRVDESVLYRAFADHFKLSTIY